MKGYTGSKEAFSKVVVMLWSCEVKGDSGTIFLGVVINLDIFSNDVKMLHIVHLLLWVDKASILDKVFVHYQPMHEVVRVCFGMRFAQKVHF